VTGCSGWDDAMQTVVDDEYTVKLRTEPSPPGRQRGNASRCSIDDDRNRTVRACHISFRQYMPEHEMSSDDIVVQMEEQRSGVYSGISPAYSMGGDWRIEVNFDCGSGIRQANFDFSLDWE
jgi:hypothetical protein